MTQSEFVKLVIKNQDQLMCGPIHDELNRIKIAGIDALAASGRLFDPEPVKPGSFAMVMTRHDVPETESPKATTAPLNDFEKAAFVRLPGVENYNAPRRSLTEAENALFHKPHSRHAAMRKLAQANPPPNKWYHPSGVASDKFPAKPRRKGKK